MTLRSSILDGVLVGFPVNLQQRLAIAELESKITILENKNAKLKAEIKKLRLKHDFPADTCKLLKHMFEAGGVVYPERVASRLKWKIGIINYHFDLLRKHQFAGFRNITTVGHPIPYFLTEKGRAFVVVNGIA